MAVNHPETQPAELRYSTYDDDVIDLRIYIDVLLRWWREIALLAILGALGAGAAALILENAQAPAYQTSSTAIMARVTSNVTLDERFQTASGENANIDAARRASLTGLVQSGAIAAAVIEDLGDALPSELRSTPAILEQIEANAVPSADNRTPSDLIRITATADSPEIAAAIANSWMRHYVNEANALYGQVPAEVYDAVVAEQAEADASFAAAQQNLETFIAQSRIQSLTRQVAERQALVDFLNQSRIDAGVSALAQDVSLRRAIFERLSAAQIEPALALLDEQTRQRVQSIADLFATRTRAARQLAQARALQAQIEAGGDAAAASNAVALQLLKAQAFADDTVVEPRRASLNPDPENQDEASTALPASQPVLQQWSIDGGTSLTTADAQMQDITALVSSLESYLAELDELIAATGAATSSGDGYLFLDQLTPDAFAAAAQADAGADDPSAESELAAAILASYADLFETGDLVQLGMAAGEAASASDQPDAITALEQEIQQLSAQLEAEQSRERQLTQQRDLAWNAYDTLSNKTVELDLERTAANREVRAGTEATPPLEPIPGRSSLLAAVIGGVIGLLAGILLAFLMDYQNKQPFLARRRTAEAA